jgi:capsular polysaccharide export protein
MKPINVGPDGARRTFVFLQGPHGSLFWRIGQAILRRGHLALRINFNGGDRHDWPDAATDFRGSAAAWPSFFDAFVANNAVTDVVLYGDCRPLHRGAHIVGRVRGLRVWVFEEGYLRPDWMTLEFEGVNGFSSLPQNAGWFLSTAAALPPVPQMPPVPSDTKRRMRETLVHYFHSRLQSWRFRRYKSHRPDPPSAEAFGWLRRRLGAVRSRRRSQRRGVEVVPGRYFLLPLQLNSDYQIRVHSDFPGMAAAVYAVMASFARAAPPANKLVIKLHPLDNGTLSWPQIIAAQAGQLGLADRVVFLEHGDTAKLVGEARGVVTVNSTVGALALGAGIPTAVMGRAIYSIPGLTHEGPLDDFWNEPVVPDATLWEAMVRVLHAHCLIRGGLTSEEGLSLLVEGAVERLLSAEVGLPVNRSQAGF